MTKRKVLLCTLLATSCAMAAGAASADDEAREIAAFRKAPVSLAGAIQKAEGHSGATAMSAEFEFEHGKGVYDVELLAADGTMLEVEIDADSDEVIDVEKQGLAADDDQDDDD